jgi:GAF domain-containing protein
VAKEAVVSDVSDADVPAGLPAAFLGLGGVLLGEDTVDDLLDRVVQLAVATVPSAQSVSITVAQDGKVHTANSSGPAALELDRAQYAGGGGPCLEAIEGSQLEADLVDPESPWPHLRAPAAEQGVRKVLSTPLGVRERRLGALNIYSRSASGFSDAEKHAATLFGDQAAVLVANAMTLMSSQQIAEQLRAALASREIIGEAKGILMQQQTCTRDEAFDILRRASQRENRKLRELAEALVLALEARAQAKGARA